MLRTRLRKLSHPHTARTSELWFLLNFNPNKVRASSIFMRIPTRCWSQKEGSQSRRTRPLLGRSSCTRTQCSHECRSKHSYRCWTRPKQVPISWPQIWMRLKVTSQKNSIYWDFWTTKTRRCTTASAKTHSMPTTSPDLNPRPSNCLSPTAPLWNSYSDIETMEDALLLY